MGLLDRLQAMWGQQQMQPPQPYGIQPTAPAPAMPQMQTLQQPMGAPPMQLTQPQAMQTPQMVAPPPPPPPPSGWSQLSRSVQDGSLFEAPMMQAGLSILGNSGNGGDWAAASRQIMEGGQQRRQAGRERRQDQMQETAFNRQQTEWGQADQQRADWQAAMQGEQDPERRRVLQAIGPQGYGDYIARERQMQFQAREGQLDRDASLRAAQVRSANENSLGRYFQAQDASQIGELNQQAAQLQAVGLPQLRQLRQTIQQAGTSLTGQPLDYNSRITLGRVFNGSASDRQTLEVWRAQILGPALETLRGLGAMSEREMEAAVNSFSNPNMPLGAAMQLIDEKISTAERRIASAQATSEFFTDAGGLTGVRNRGGQDYATFLAERLGASPGGGATGDNSVPRGGYVAPPSAAIAELRRDTSAAARAEFDQTFGPGAAQRALAGAGSRPSSGNPSRAAQQGPREGQTRSSRFGREVFRGGRWVADR